MKPTPWNAPADRRTLLRTAATLSAAGSGGALQGTAAATDDPGLSDFAPVPAAATGPKPKESGYFVGRIDGNLHWVHVP